MDKLTPDELSTNWETQKHIDVVRLLLKKFATELESRGLLHDKSKLDHPEVSTFTKVTSQLADLTYGSDEYKACLSTMGDALDHHYVCNRHHPEAFEDGVNDMNLIDIVEMFCDWKAAGMRHKDGNLGDSISHNEERFNISPQLVSIFENTIEFMDTAVDPGCGTLHG